MNLSRRSILVAGTGAVARAALQTGSGRKPNILWICTDQQRWDTIHALGNKAIPTPNIDKLLASGVAFTGAHCQAPICTPSRGSFLTGMYASSVHACMNGNDKWADAAPLVTRLLADGGYYCGLVGKLHLSSAAGRIERRPDDGYREFYWNHDPSGSWPKGDAYRDWLKSKGYELKALKKKYGYFPTEFHQTTWCANTAIDFMSAHRDRPWLMSVNIYDPHPEFNPPPEYLKRIDMEQIDGPHFHASDLSEQKKLEEVHFQSKARDPREFDGKLTKAKYLGEVALIDDNVGRMMKCLEETGQRENTIVIFMSDHGETCGDHGLLYKGCRFYEGLVRVPLIFSWPGHFKQGLESPALVELIDVGPTLLEVAGLNPSKAMQGRSLLPILTGKASPMHHRESVRCEYFRALGTTMQRDHLTESFGTMIRTPEHKLVVYHGTGLGELFDMKSDPWEFRNLWDEQASTRTKLELMNRSFDQLVFATDLGSERVGRY